MISLAARMLRRTAQALEGVSTLHQVQVQKVMSEYNMMTNLDELYYAQQYLHWIFPECQKRFQQANPYILDAGCGQGRLALPLAKWAKDGHVVGVDFTPAVIESVRHYASEQGISNVEFHLEDVLFFVKKLPDASFDIVLMTEVAFFLPTYRELMVHLFRVLRPKGLFFGSFWSQYYRLLQCIKSRNWEGAKTVLNQTQGYWGNGSVWFSWNTAEGVRRMLSELGFAEVQLRGIGIASGIQGDSLAMIAQPSKLSSDEQQKLMDLEISLAERYVDQGRYILAMAERV